jgi:CheY-like chemotaxis protein
MNMTEENKNIKILIVDDDHFLLDMYSLKFKTLGLQIDTADGSTKALQKIREGESPDIILLDIIMPTMDGLELLKVIRDEKLASKAVVVVLTNQSDRMDTASSLGADGYIIKAMNIPSEVVNQVMKIYHEKKK